MDGEIQWDRSAAAHITERDLLGRLRAQVQLDDLQAVQVAHLERSGDIE